MLDVSTRPNIQLYCRIIAKKPSMALVLKQTHGSVGWNKGHTYKPMQQWTVMLLCRCKKDTDEKRKLLQQMMMGKLDFQEEEQKRTLISPSV